MNNEESKTCILKSKGEVIYSMTLQGFGAGTFQFSITHNIIIFNRIHEGNAFLNFLLVMRILSQC